MAVASSPNASKHGVTRLVNGRIIRGNTIVKEDLWISSVTGKILNGQDIFYQQQATASETIDLEGRLVAPGFIDVQVNGAFGFDFSAITENTETYKEGIQKVNQALLRTGVTSYLPTLPSQLPVVYEQALPCLGPSGTARDPSIGCESLGAHCEGPFLSPHKSGAHNPGVLKSVTDGLQSLEACYGSTNLSASGECPIKLITLAPEQLGMLDVISELHQRNIIVSIGHSAATLEVGLNAVEKGATMVTHLFNAMPAPVAREPGVFGLLASLPGTADQKRPYFGMVADKVHLHPNTLSIAYHAHPTGCVLVTDSAWPLGLPDGTYGWTNGDSLTKRGSRLTLEGTDTLAGSCATLIECVNNMWLDVGVGLCETIAAVTTAPAKLLGLEGVKGSLEAGADADLVVLDDSTGRLEVDKVWKFGTKVFG